MYFILSKGAMAVLPKQPEMPPIINLTIWGFYLLFSLYI